MGIVFRSSLKFKNWGYGFAAPSIAGPGLAVSRVAVPPFSSTSVKSI
jgi:hypothetical protein